MSPRLARLALWLALGAAVAACNSPEARRVREGGPGADPGNRRGMVQMHEGANPYYKTPERIPGRIQAPTTTARQADRLSRGQPDPATSPAQK